PQSCRGSPLTLEVLQNVLSDALVTTGILLDSLKASIVKCTSEKAILHRIKIAESTAPVDGAPEQLQVLDLKGRSQAQWVRFESSIHGLIEKGQIIGRLKQAEK